MYGRAEKAVTARRRAGETVTVCIGFLSTRSLLSLQSSINDGADFKAVADAMKVIGFTGDEIQTVYKILATILHLVTRHNIRSFCCPPVQTVPCWQE